MKTDLDKVITKLDDISDDIGAIKITLAEQAVQLKEHIRRTELAEGRIDDAEDAIDDNKKNTAFVKGIVYAMGLIGGLLTLAAGIWAAYKA